MLSVKNLHAYYGDIEALKGLTLEIKEGAITCLVGNNGAGKSTLLKAISGMVKRTGSITFDGSTEMIGKKPQEIAQNGIIHVPEGRLIFPGLTVEQNLETGTINWHGFFGNQPYDKELEEVYTLFPRLKERRNQYGWSLSGGEQQMLAVGRALMARPKVLMLDEPSMGLAPLLVTEVFEKIIQINHDSNMTVLLVEQNAKSAMKISDYCYVLDNGRIAMSGDAKELADNPDIIKAYFGGMDHKEKMAKRG